MAPPFYYYRYGIPLRPGDPDWDRPLPLDRNGGQAGSAPFTCGDYFRAAQDFLSGASSAPGQGGPLDQALGESRSPITRVDISLEKHGALYHPARVRVHTEAKQLSRVLNLAVSEAGRARMAEEYQTLCRLGRQPVHSHLPRVYAMGEQNGAWPVSMFLGEWFEGYHEFHLSRTDQGLALHVWDPAQSEPVYLSPAQARALYREAARILTDGYAPLSCEQIRGWHHAAGDFVVRVQGDELSLKLITVRSHGSPFAGSHDLQLLDILWGLLCFLVETGLRMRLDRLEGTGELVLGPEMALEESIQGVFAGLAQKDIPAFDSPLIDFFQAYIRRLDPDDIRAAGAAVLGAFAPDAPERALIAEHMTDHLAALSDRIGSC